MAFTITGRGFENFRNGYFGWRTNVYDNPLLHYGSTAASDYFQIVVENDNLAYLYFSGSLRVSSANYLGAIGNGIEPPLWVLH